MGNFFEENGVAEKLRVAIEDLRIGRGLSTVFRGLENGSCLVEVVYNGTNISIVNKMPEPEPVVVEEPEEAENEVGDVGEQETTESPEPEEPEIEENTVEEPVIEEEKPKRKRKKQVENSKS